VLPLPVLLAEEELQRRVPLVPGEAVGQLAEVQQLDGDFVCVKGD